MKNFTLCSNESRNMQPDSELDECPACGMLVDISADMCPNCGDPRVRQPPPVPLRARYNTVKLETVCKQYFHNAGGVKGIAIKVGKILLIISAILMAATAFTFGGRRR